MANSFHNTCLFCILALVCVTIGGFRAAFVEAQDPHLPKEEGKQRFRINLAKIPSFFCEI